MNILSYIPILIVSCISNADCQQQPDSPVCKETVYGGAKTCQESLSCTEECAESQFCDASNNCREGRLISKHNLGLYFSVLCATNADCSSVPGLPTCKELVNGGPLTCQANSTCLAVDTCQDDQYCASSDVCITVGMICPFVALFLDSFFVVYCRSNSDCRLPGLSVCKEMVSGKAKICQSFTSCTDLCPLEQFCDASNTCQNGR